MIKPGRYRSASAASQKQASSHECTASWRPDMAITLRAASQRAAPMTHVHSWLPLQASPTLLISSMSPMLAIESNGAMAVPELYPPRKFAANESPGICTNLRPTSNKQWLSSRKFPVSSSSGTILIVIVITCLYNVMMRTSHSTANNRYWSSLQGCAWLTFERNFPYGRVAHSA